MPVRLLKSGFGFEFNTAEKAIRNIINY
ncbi:hypothetical protein ACLI1A_07695 [Flavobacterium sp. RHBU_3]